MFAVILEGRRGRDEQWRGMLFETGAEFVIAAQKAELALKDACDNFDDASTDTNERAAEIEHLRLNAQVAWSRVQMAFGIESKADLAAQGFLDHTRESIEALRGPGQHDERFIEANTQLLLADDAAKDFIEAAHAAMHAPIKRKAPTSGFRARDALLAAEREERE